MNTQETKKAGGDSVHRLVRPIPSSIKEYTARLEKLHSNSLGAGVCGNYEACAEYGDEMKQVVAELAAWCGCNGSLTKCHVGMGTVTINGKTISDLSNA